LGKTSDRLSGSRTLKTVFFQFNPGTFHINFLRGCKLFADLITRRGARLDVLNQFRVIGSLQIPADQTFHIQNLSGVLSRIGGRPDAVISFRKPRSFQSKAPARREGAFYFEAVCGSQSVRTRSIGHDL
jgi:hypothetical protein